MIELRKEIYKTTYCHPRKNFEITDVYAEMRYDPLTGHRVRVYEIDWCTRPVNFYELGSKSAHRCPFCEGALEKYGARFHPQFCKEGHMKNGEVTLIPNILPYAENAAVAVLTKEHVVPMGRMSEETIFNAFSLIFNYAIKVSEFQKKQYKYAHLHWNYMPTSGGSIIHPHMQVYVTDEPLNYHKRLLEKSVEFYNSHGKEFFKTYSEYEERERVRFITKSGRSVLLSPFASRGMLGEFIIIVNDVFNYNDFTIDDLSDISGLIHKAMLFFEKRLIPGFNMALYTSPINSQIMQSHIRIYPRVYRDTDTFATDVETPTLLYGESFSLISPEKNAALFRKFIENIDS